MSNFLNILVSFILILSVFMSKFKFMLQNIRSLRKNYDSLVCHIDSMAQLPKLIVLTEIWVNDFEISNFAIAGFNTYASCNNTYRSGGVAVFVADCLNARVRNFDFKTADLLVIDVYFGNTKATIVCIYRLQMYSVESFLIEFSSLLPKIKSKNLLVMGDVNIDILGSSSFVDEYKFLMSSHGLFCEVDVPTRISNISATCIDHVYYRCPDFDIDSRVEDLAITDHCAIFVDLFISVFNVQSSNNYTNVAKSMIDFNLLNSLLLMESWDNVLSIADIS